MKIALDVAQTCTERAGCGWFADGVARALARRRDVDLELLHHFGTWWNRSTTGGTHIAGVREPLAELDFDAARAFWTRTEVDGLPSGPDVAWSTSFEAPAIARCRLVYTVHDVAFWRHPNFATDATRLACQRGILDALGRAAAFVFNSEATRQDFLAALPGCSAANKTPHVVAWPGSRFAHEEPGARSADAPWLCVGSVEPRKNHATLLEAYHRYRRSTDHPRPLWVVGGRGWASDEIHGMLAARTHEGVSYLGYAADDALLDLYRRAFAVVQPSWHEGFGLPVVEAMGFGCPLVCSDIPSHREIAGDAAAFAAPADAAGFAAAMAALDADRAAWERAMAASRARASLFSWDTMAAKVLAFMASVFGDPPALAPTPAVRARPAAPPGAQVSPSASPAAGAPTAPGLAAPIPEAPAPPASSEGVLHHIDEPARWDSPAPLLFVRGWCFGSELVPVIGVEAVSPEGRWAGVHGLPRPDVAAAFGNAAGSGRSGFALRLPRPSANPAELRFEAVLADGRRLLLASAATG